MTRPQSCKVKTGRGAATIRVLIVAVVLTLAAVAVVMHAVSKSVPPSASSSPPINTSSPEVRATSDSHAVPKSLNARPGARTEARPLALTRANPATIFGRATFEDRRPAAGAKVWIAGAEDRITTANTQGEFEITGASSGAYYLLAALNDFISDPEGDSAPSFEAKAGERQGPYQLILRPGLTLQGLVRDLETGKPVAGAEIRRYAAERLNIYRALRAQSDAEGAWRLAGLPPGEVSLLAIARGYAAKPAIVPMIAGARNTCDLRLEPGGTITVLVQDEAGRPIAGAQIVPSRDFSSLKEGLLGLKTDESGRAIIENV
ncbi:MAG: carboxypeptidase-like regulatory domain-containing protein, partial [Candidatus Sumerlaeota bacterium]|nr:carboxypeptidase-like regulatory domain-containing protein [Candidatus Sumerlaeota bacterium]